ncbi:MAG: class II aldolase/adducin family protein [Candidatus Liptonbacteria bacterium]|nr:class II aldolase/adducin family protein [Candidatus Liptonbacteria bacterium]
MNKLNNFFRLSQNIGSSPAYAQGAGGNISVKIGKKMYVKASGCLLKDLKENKGYIACDFEKVRQGLEEASFAKSENDFNLWIQKNSFGDESFGEASIEAGMHAVFDSEYVIHSHSVYANVFNCMEGGEKVLKEIFKGQDTLFVPYYNPGFNLALAIYRMSRKMELPQIIFLENHGVITHGHGDDKALNLHAEMNKTIENYLFNFNIGPFQLLNKPIDFSKHLFPDSAVFSDVNLGEISEFKKTGYYEIASAADYIIGGIKSIKGTPKFINESDVFYIKNMSKEKIRLKMVS